MTDIIPEAYVQNSSSTRLKMQAFVTEFSGSVDPG